MQIAGGAERYRSKHANWKVIRHGGLRQFSTQTHRTNDRAADDDPGKNAHREDHDDHGGHSWRVVGTDPAEVVRLDVGL